MPEKLIFVLLCSLLLMCSCDKKNTASNNLFPATQFQIESYTSQNDIYWNSGIITSQNDNRQIITLEHDENDKCFITLQSLDKVSLSALSIMYMPGDKEIVSDGVYLQVQKQSNDIIALFLTSEISDILHSEWKEFLTYWENPVKCEGNRIQWNGGNKDYAIQIKLSRTGPDALWLLENITVYSEEFKQIHRQEMRRIIREYPEFREYASIAEMETNLRFQVEECYGAVNGEIGALEFHSELPYQDFLREYPNFLSSQEGYACGVLSDSTGSLEVWCSPGLEIADNKQVYYFHYLPGEIPVIYIRS